MGKKKLPEFGFNVLRIFDSVFFVEEALNPDPNEVQISYGLGLYANAEESWVQYNIKAEFWTETTKTFATGTVVTKFGVDGLKSFADENGVITWPDNTLEAMFGIAFSHMRALFGKNMATTKFSSYIVPLVNPIALFRQLADVDPNISAIESESSTKAQL